MVEPLTLAAVGALALTEGIKFLYGQAGEALKRWRQNKDAAGAVPVTTQLPPEAFEGALEAPEIHLDVVATMEQEIQALRAALADYVDAGAEVSPDDPAVVGPTDALRRAMEAVYGQTITFKGEQRPSEPTVRGEVIAKEVAGKVVGLRAAGILSGSASGGVVVDRVEKGGEAVGAELGTIGTAGG